MPAVTPEFAELIALAVHDLRNPLATLVANLAYLRSVIGRPGSDAADALADSQLACARLDGMTRSLVAIGRALSHSEPPRRPTSLDDVIRAAVDRARPAAEASRVAIDLGGGNVPLVSVEAELLGIAFDNVLANSIQHSRAGQRVAVQLDVAAGLARVTVIDDGPIVPAALRDAAMRAEGQRAAKERADMRYGLGLGLYAASAAAGLAGATLAITERGGRAAFEISAEPVTAER